MSVMTLNLIQSLVTTISKQVKNFNKAEIEHLIRMFNGLTGDLAVPGRMVTGLDRGTFRQTLYNMFAMTNDMMMDRVFHVFDKDNDGIVNVKEWIGGLSVFLRGTLDEKIKYCFDVYDLNGDGYISREEMFQMLKHSVRNWPDDEDPDEGVKYLVEIALKLMDYDHDSRISPSDFTRKVKEEELLLEAFGPCLPDANTIMEFERNAFEEPLER